MLGRAEERPRHHYVVGIGDTNDPKIGRNLGEDAENFVAVMRQAFKAAGREAELSTFVLVGNAVTPEKIVDFLERLPVGPNDTLSILISCHGGMDSQNRHYFALGRSRLDREKVLAAMRRQNPRLTVLLSDCCSSYADACAQLLTTIEKMGPADWTAMAEAPALSTTVATTV